MDWTSKEFKTIKNMRDTLSCELESDHMCNDNFLLGYFFTGHSFKGKQLPLSSDDQLNEMYAEHHNRKSINLWVKSQVSKAKRPRNDSENGSDTARPAKRSNVYDSHLEKMVKLEEILERLKTKYQGSKYTPEQLHCWANLIQLKKHDSYEVAPDKPFFGKKSQANSGVSSPGKRIQLHTQCIDQLTKWHKLMEDGVITNEEYKEMHKTIMSDIKKF